MESQIDYEQQFFKHIAWDLYSNLWSIDNWEKEPKGMKVSKNLFSEDSPFFNHEIKDRKDYPTGSNIKAICVEYWLGNTHSIANIRFHDPEMNKYIEICAEVFDHTTDGMSVIHQFMMDPSIAVADSCGFRAYLETRNTESYQKIYQNEKDLIKNMNYPLIIKKLNKMAAEYKTSICDTQKYKNIEFARDCRKIIDWGYNCHTWVIDIINAMTNIPVDKIKDEIMESMLELGQRMKRRQQNNIPLSDKQKHDTEESKS